MSLSVILCTHNPRPDCLRRCLEGLERQTLDPSQWELVVVDNRSDKPVAGRIDLSRWQSARILREEQLGLTPARLRGIRESSGELLVFVDDDNVLDQNYLETALRVAEACPFLGSWSGQCRPQFERPPPEWTRRYLGNLVIREFERDVWSNLPRLPDSMPCGAGLCVRRTAAAHYLALHESGRRSVQLDRAGGSLMSGGDNDLAACACDVGLGLGLIASLKLTHLIPADRLTQTYLARLVDGIHFSSALLDAERGMPVPKRTWVNCVLDWLRLRRLTEPHRTIVRSAYAGRNRALKLVASRNLTIATYPVQPPKEPL